MEEKEIRKIFKYLRNSGVEYALIGRLACTLWGHSVSTHDIDIVVPSNMKNIDLLSETLYGLGYTSVWIHIINKTIRIEELSEAIVRRYKVLKFIGRIPIDIILIKNEREWEFIRKRIVPFDMHGVKVKLADIDYLIYTKMHSKRLKDLDDAEILIKLKKRAEKEGYYE
jgi:predicted nucleotidyltransferase